MPIASSVQVIMRGSLQNQNIENRFIWFNNAEYPNTLGSSITASFYGNVWQASWQTLLHANYELRELIGWYSDFTIGPKLPYTLAVNESGDVIASECLQSYATVVCTKDPDNATRFPASNPEFRRGFFGLSGVPEGQQSDGLVIPAYISQWNAAFEAVEELSLDTNGGGVQVFSLGMYRDSKVVAERTYAYVSETQVKPVLGTRVSRKRN